LIVSIIACWEFYIVFECFIFLAFIIVVIYNSIKLNIADITLVLLVLFSVLFGEVLNLFVFKATSYTDAYGIPAYIIFAGSLLAWSVFRLSFLLQKNLQLPYFSVFFLSFLLSFLMPIVEYFGVQSNLWYWNKPYIPFSLNSFIGVWKFYFTFVLSPVFLIELILFLKQKKEK
jgi:hypothetical protein